MIRGSAPSGAEAVVGVFTKGSSFGEAVAFRHDTYPVAAEAVTDCTLIRIEADAFLRQIRENPEVAISILSATFVHLHGLVAQVEALKAQTGAQRVAEFLQDHPLVSWVNYPGLSDSPHHAMAQKQFRSIDGGPGSSGILTFGIQADDPAKAGERFIDACEFLSHLANIGDAKTLVIHPASTTHRQLDEAELARAGVRPDMVRLSVGIEDAEDIIWDIDQALRQAVRA